MDSVEAQAKYKTIKIRIEQEIAYLQIHRPDANNAINDILVDELSYALSVLSTRIKIIVLEGLDDVFCMGADFKVMQQAIVNNSEIEQNPEAIYALWLQLAQGDFISIAHVRGTTNAGGVGFIAACDIVICEERSTFSLSELLFGLMPACVLPFLIRKVGKAKAHYMTLMTQPVSAKDACDWGLVNSYDENSQNLLRKHLLRLRLISKKAIKQYKNYSNSLDDSLNISMPFAIEANKKVFSDPDNLEKIERYVSTGLFPWEPS